MEHKPSINELISQGLICAHSRINLNTTKIIESNAFLYALIELLQEKGLLAIEELDARKKQVAERLVKKFKESGCGLLVQEPECDKYNFPLEAKADCESRISICKAVCCKFPFALSRQDVDECLIRWDFGHPYLIAHDADGYCVHLDRDSHRCTVHDNRPVPCRGFNCKDNERWQVWSDYDRKIINPELLEQTNFGY